MIYAIIEKDHFDGSIWSHGYYHSPALALGYACHAFEMNEDVDVPADMELAAAELLNHNQIATLNMSDGDLLILPLVDLEKEAELVDQPTEFELAWRDAVAG